MERYILISVAFIASVHQPKMALYQNIFYSEAHAILFFCSSYMVVYVAGAHQNSSNPNSRQWEKEEWKQEIFEGEKAAFPLSSTLFFHSMAICWFIIKVQCNNHYTTRHSQKFVSHVYIALLDLLLTFKSILLCPLNFKDVISKTF